MNLIENIVPTVMSLKHIVCAYFHFFLNISPSYKPWIKIKLLSNYCLYYSFYVWNFFQVKLCSDRIYVGIVCDIDRNPVKGCGLGLDLLVFQADLFINIQISRPCQVKACIIFEAELSNPISVYICMAI